MPAVQFLTLAGQHFHASEWEAWRTSAGHVVYRSVYGYGDGDSRRFMWTTTYNGAVVLNTFDGAAGVVQSNAFLANPGAWEAANNAHRHEVEISSGGFAHAIGNAIHSVGHVISDTVSFGLELDEALLHPLTVNSNGLQLSSDAIQIVPDSLQSLAQTVTSFAGYGVVAAAAVTAIGGIGAIEEAASSVSSVVSGASGVVSGAQEVLGFVDNFIPQGVTPFIPETPAAVAAAVAPDGIVHDAAQGLGEGLGSVLVIGFIAWLLLRRKS